MTDQVVVAIVAGVVGRVRVEKVVAVARMAALHRRVGGVRGLWTVRRRVAGGRWGDHVLVDVARRLWLVLLLFVARFVVLFVVRFAGLSGALIGFVRLLARLRLDGGLFGLEFDRLLLLLVLLCGVLEEIGSVEIEIPLDLVVRELIVLVEVDQTLDVRYGAVLDIFQIFVDEIEQMLRQKVQVVR